MAIAAVAVPTMRQPSSRRATAHSPIPATALLSPVAAPPLFPPVDAPFLLQGPLGNHPFLEDCNALWSRGRGRVDSLRYLQKNTKKLFASIAFLRSI